MFVLQRPDGNLVIEELGDNLRKLTAVPSSPNSYSSRTSCTTTYPLDLIELFLDSTGVAGVCEVIGRDSDPDSVATNIAELTAAYCDPTEIVHKTILDFGCGGGGSSVVLAKLFPQCQVVGIDLREDKIRLARARAQHHGLENVAFFVAPSGTELPPDIGPFDFVYLFAVYEHLLPVERPIIMKLVWSRLKPGGILFIDATPHRYFPIELHSTKLPLINYFPSRVVHSVVRKFSLAGGKINKSPVWEDHLRGGIRGATEKEILRNIGQADGSIPVLLEPTRLGLKDRCDYWYSRLSPKYRALKKAFRACLKTVYHISGTVLTPNLSIAIQKRG
jgi:SAM-dependent methyltransferase